MKARPSTLRGSIMLAAFALVGTVLIVAFGAVDVLLSRQVAGDLARTAGDQLRYLDATVSHHQQSGNDNLIAELVELERQTAILAQVRQDNRLIFSSPRLAAARLPERAGPTHVDGQRYYVAASATAPFVLAVAVPAAPLEHIHRQLRSIMVVCLAMALLASGLGARWLAARAVSPLDHLAAAAEGIDVRNLGDRIDVGRRSKLEVDRLIGSFNRMLARLESAVNGLRRFTADASHELRTPLAILKTQLQADPSVSAVSQLEEVDRLQALLDDLLLLSRLDAAAADRERLDLSDVAIETAEQMRTLAEQKGISLTVTIGEPFRLAGDRRQLRRLLMNLLDNAVKYTPAGGAIQLTMVREREHVRLEVSDTGVGIAREHLPHIFEPFFRADSSRSRDTGGAGLGLAISARIAGNHGASIVVDSTPNRGTCFSVLLPLDSYEPPICAA